MPWSAKCGPNPPHWLRSAQCNSRGLICDAPVLSQPPAWHDTLQSNNFKGTILQPEIPMVKEQHSHSPYTSLKAEEWHQNCYTCSVLPDNPLFTGWSVAGCFVPTVKNRLGSHWTSLSYGGDCPTWGCFTWSKFFCLRQFLTSKWRHFCRVQTNYCRSYSLAVPTGHVLEVNSLLRLFASMPTYCSEKTPEPILFGMNHSRYLKMVLGRGKFQPSEDLCTKLWRLW